MAGRQTWAAAPTPQTATRGTSRCTRTGPDMNKLSLDSLIDAYAALSQRDRRLALVGAVALLGLVLFSVLIPLDRAVTHARARLEQKRADLNWMRTVAVPVLRNAPPPSANAES